MSLRWLSRDRSGVHRITGTPLAVRVVDVAAEEMPPRPPEGRQPADEIWGIGAATVVNPDPLFDPCGAPAIGAGSRGRKRWP